MAGANLGSLFASAGPFPAALMMPYVDAGPLELGSVAVDIEALLTALGVAFAVVLAHQRARRVGIDTHRLDSFLVWVLVGTVVGGHISDVLLYRLDEVVTVSGWHIVWRDPLEFFRLWHGWRSVGGAFGGVAGALLWSRYVFRSSTWFTSKSGDLEIEGYRFVRRERPERILELADVVLAVFPIAWMLNRAGSLLVHDRPGTRASSSALLTIDYPSPADPMHAGFDAFQSPVPRHNLSLLELLLTAWLLVATILLWRKSSRSGLFVWLVGFVYPPGRIAIEFLARTTGPDAPPRLWGYTPTQWGFAVLSVFLVVALARVRRHGMTAEAA